MAGLIGNRPQRRTHENASEAAVHHLTRVALERDGLVEAWLGDTPLGRPGPPDAIASVAHVLASDAASLMTGTVVVVAGGFTGW